jgi:hypothetical protein
MISCVCATHGRHYHVNEAVESYLRQENCGEPTELLVFNDCPEQRLYSDAPGVRCVNTTTLYADLADKFSAAIIEAKGDKIAWWEDDDISLPFRLRFSAKAMSDSGKPYYKQEKAWFWNNGDITGLAENSLFFGSALFERDHAIGSGLATRGEPGDTSLHCNMIAGGNGVVHAVMPESLYFVYRWAGMGHHDSGIGGTNADRFAAFRRGTLNDRRFVAGDVDIKPKWRHDYNDQYLRAVDRQKSAQDAAGCV